MAGKSKMLQAIVEIAGNISPTLQSSIQEATGKLEGLNLKAMAIGAAVGGAAIATGKAVLEAGKYLYQLGEQFDSAEDTIRIGTGAVGDSLDDLMDSFDEVYSSIPTTMEDASKAISDYNTRLGLTGENLEEMSKQAISVSNMLGEDLTTVIEASSRAIQNWNIDESHMSEAMDYMFKVSQATGVSFSDLSTEMQTYGAQLQEVGYSFKDASTLLGQVQKEGYDASAIITALKTAAKNAATDGFDSINDGMATYIAEIQNAKDDTEAYSMATKYFGNKAAATMLQAIKKGTLNLESFKDALDASDESITGAAEDTYDLTEWLTIMKSKLQVALEPMASSIFSQISDMMPTLISMIDQFVPVIMDAVQQSLPFVEQFLGGINDLLPVIVPAIVSLGEALLPILTDLLGSLLPPLLELIQNLIPPMIEILETILPPIVDIITQILPIVTEIINAILPVLINLIAEIMPVLKPVFDILLDMLHSIIEPILEPLMNLVSAVLQPLLPLLKAISPILEVIGAVLTPIAKVIGIIVDAISTVVGWIADGLGWLVDLFFGGDEDAADTANSVATYAKGGFATAPSICGEDGTEAVISFDPAYRERNIAILEQAALMLGLSGDVNNDYAAEYQLEESSYTAQAGKLLALDDFSLSETASGSTTYYYDFSGFTWSPTIESGSENSEDIISMIEAQEAEFFEWLQAFVKAREVGCFG